MTIHDLIDQFTIQGGFCIKRYDYENDDMVILAEGHDFECEYYDIAENILDSEITYMYAVDGVLNIELSDHLKSGF